MSSGFQLKRGGFNTAVFPQSGRAGLGGPLGGGRQALSSYLLMDVGSPGESMLVQGRRAGVVMAPVSKVFRD